jgi:hypothetical protein
VVDFEGGCALAECVTANTQALDIGGEGEVEEGGEEACVSEGGVDENTLKIPGRN